MKKYSANNSILNYDRLLTVFIIAIPFLFFIPKTGTAFLVAFIGILLTALILSIKLFLKLSFEINFMENEIIIDYFNRNRKVIYNYSDLLSVTYKQVGKGISTNEFTFSDDHSIKIYKTSLIASGENFVTFIKYLKSKNNAFKTYIQPKGSELHLKLRKELLGTEY